MGNVSSPICSWKAEQACFKRQKHNLVNVLLCMLTRCGGRLPHQPDRPVALISPNAASLPSSDSRRLGLVCLQTKAGIYRLTYDTVSDRGLTWPSPSFQRACYCHPGQRPGEVTSLHAFEPRLLDPHGSVLSWQFLSGPW